MPTLPEIKEKVVRLMESGVKTVETKLDDHYVYATIHSARAFVLKQDFIKNRQWSPQAIQQYFPQYEDFFQDSVCYTRFELPTGFIQANSNEDGLVYFGSSTNKILETNNFWRINNRAELASFLDSPRMTPASGKYIGIMFEGLIGTVISKNPFKNPMVSAVFSDPTALEDFNINQDLYPIPNDLEDTMYQYIVQTTMGMVYSKNTSSPYDSQEAVKYPIQTK